MRKMKSLQPLRLGCILISMGAIFAGVVWGQTRASKKVIEFGWDEPDTAFMRKHLAEMEKRPFDGCVFHVMYDRPDGSKGSFMNECWGSRAFKVGELKGAIDDLRSRKFTRITDNFLRINVLTGE